MSRRGGRLRHAPLAAAAAAACALGGGATAAGTDPIVHFDRSKPALARFNDVELAPIDGDSDADLIACLADYPGQLDVAFYPNVGNGFFERDLQEQTAVGDLCHDLTVVHLDGDGILDLAVSESYFTSVPDPDPEVVTLLGDGDGTFTPAGRYPLEAIGSDIAAGDFDGDDNLDVAVSEPAADQVEVLVGNGDGTLGATEGHTAGGSPGRLAVGDLKEDGVDDLLSTNFGSDDFSVFLGQELIGLGDETRIGPVARPKDIGTGDFDGDGDLDVAVLGGGAIRLYNGNGEGDLLPANRFETGRDTTYLEVADFNADGVLDLAATWQSLLGVYFGQGDGGFSQATAFSLAPHAPHSIPAASSLAAGNLSSDEYVDLVSAAPRLVRFRAVERLYACHGRTATVVGSEGDDALWMFRNVPRRRTIVAARGGVDRGTAWSGDDLVCLGGGDDDWFWGGGDADRIYGGPGNDTRIQGGSGADLLVGGSGDDLLGQYERVHEGGDDVLLGGRGRDLLDGGRDSDLCNGGPGSDGGIDCERTRLIP